MLSGAQHMTCIDTTEIIALKTVAAELEQHNF